MIHAYSHPYLHVPPPATPFSNPTPAQVDASNYVNQAASTTQAPGTLNTPAGVATTSPPQHCDAAALAHDLAGFLGKARAGIESPGLSTSDTIGENGATTGASCHWCDVVLVHGSEALDPDLLHPEGFALGPAGALSVFVHTTPQVSSARRTWGSCPDDCFRICRP